MSDHEHHGDSSLLGLVFGVIIGAGLVWFLTSTEEGKKVKEQLKKKGKDTLEDLADIVAEMEEKGEEFNQKAKEIQAELEGKAALPVLSQIEKLREQGRKAVKFFTRNGKPLA